MPLTPQEVEDKQKGNIPQFVLDIVDDLLVKHYSNGKSTVKQDAVIDKIQVYHGENFKRSTIFDNHWLDFEQIYVDLGWKVYYDKPGYNENYTAYWEFSKPK